MPLPYVRGVCACHDMVRVMVMVMIMTMLLLLLLMPTIPIQLGTR